MVKTNVMRLLDAAHIVYETGTYEVDENDLSGSHAADLMGVDHDRMYKTLEMCIRDRDETAWYLYAWSRDPLEGRFSREQKLAYGFRAAECGRSEAQLILGKTDVWDIAARMGLKVLTPQVPGGGGHVIFAQYEEPDSITIFMDGAERAQKLIREEKLEGLLGNRAVEDVLPVSYTHLDVYKRQP